MPNLDIADEDLFVAPQDLTPELLDHYPVVSATKSYRSYVALRSDERIGRLYHRDAEAELTQRLPKLWVTVTDYEEDTLARLLELVEQSNKRRLAAVK